MADILNINTTIDDVKYKATPPRNIPNDGGGGGGGGGAGAPGSSVDQCDMTSMEIVNNLHLEIFPKQKTQYDDKSLENVTDLFPILNGEYIYYMGYSGKSDEIFAITNFRIFLLMHKKTSFINVPLMLIESIEFKEIFYIYVYLKYAKTLRLTFSTSEKATLWYQRINSILNQPQKLEQLFAFSFYSWATNENAKCHFSKFDHTNLINEEFKRMKFDNKYWRISDANKKFELCPTYPEYCLVPKCITDEQLKKIASFRSSKRFPAVVWRSKVNGSVIARSSQPNVGLLAWRMNEDELLLKAIADCCSTNTSVRQDGKKSEGSQTTSGTVSVNGGSNGDAGKPVQDPMLLIIDARSRSVALANRVKGGGYEYSEYYTNCEIQFMNLENIHVIRSSFQSLKLLCQSINDNKTFYSQLENSKWLHHLLGIIKAASTVVSAIDHQAKPVLIHCSDGWDRTPQILALAKILLDPYYRTINGFKTLIEVDWLMFGHKFAQRNGHAVNHNDTSERCPVFLQWLDCVYQVFRQTPSAFEFNETYLLKLCYHSYSCLFGTFLCDSCCDRAKENTAERTFSVWSYLNANNKEIINYLYDDTFDDVIYPKCELNNMHLWQRLFCDSEITYLVQEMQSMNDSTTDVSSASGTMHQQGSLDDDAELDIQSHSIESTSSMSNSVVAASGVESSSSSSSSTRKLDESKPGSASQQRPSVPKTKSYDDLSSASFQPKLGPEFAAKANIMNVSILNDDSNNSSLDAYTNLNITTSNGDPIPTRSSSESNLLLDALQNISSTSPKLQTNVNSLFVSMKQQYSSSQSNQAASSPSTSETTTIVNGSDSTPAATTFKTENGELAEQSTAEPAEVESKSDEEAVKVVPTLSHLCASQLNGGHAAAPATASQEDEAGAKADEESLLLTTRVQQLELTEIDVKPAAPANVVAIATSLLLMQNSTETLVDEIQSARPVETRNGHPTSSSSTAAIPDHLKADDDNQPAQDDKVNGGLKTPSAAHSSESTTPLSSSSTIPSPVSSTFNLKASNVNSMSTSTSGLDDFVSMQFPMTTAVAAVAAEPSRKGSNGGTSRPAANGQALLFDVYNRYYENMRQRNEQEPTNGGNSNSSSQQPYPTHHMNGLATLLTEMNNLPKWNKVSNSIPIKKNSDDKKRKNKTVHDCIDIDGLTRIEDPTCRKVIERDEQNKREIESLREQLSKYKSFLSGLATNVQWQDIQNELTSNDTTEKNPPDENQNQSYSFSNESVSSWDEIEEADCKWATWVPDYYVTHCQNCNNQFSYRLRKHHCRNCGLVFCYKCADQFYPLPNQNFNAPVRICHSCKHSIDRQSNGHHKHLQQNGADSASDLKLNGGGSARNFAAFSSTPPNFVNSHFMNTLQFQGSPSSPSAAFNNKQQASGGPGKPSNFSPSVSPFSTSPSTNFPFLSEQSQFSQQFQPQQAMFASKNGLLNNPGTGGQTAAGASAATNCNLNLSNRCNQINSFKKKDGNSQKVSV